MIEIISHPGKPLIKHLAEVARYCAKTIGEKQLSLAINTAVLKDLGFIQGAVHDIGKATENFQSYIKSAGKIVNRPKHHALISAYLAKQIATKYLSTTDLNEFDKTILPFFIFTSVKRHHGNILNFNFELETVRNKEEDLKILVNNFYDEEVQDILNELLLEIGLEYDWENFKFYMNTLEDVFLEFDDFSMEYLMDEFEELPDLKKAEYFYLHQLFFSSLLFSDKTDVKLGDNKLSRNKYFDFDAISNYREKMKFNHPTQKINQLKNQAYFESLENLSKNFKPNQHLYSLTLPTGLGKTITSLALAMKMKKILAKQNPRIIITIPFTSIIDQNYNVFDEIFTKPSSDILLKHHHLAEPKYKIEEDTVKENDVEKAQFLIETWQSEIVVTTFVQLLEGIFTNRKGKLLKMPNMMNAIIILDEIQQIKYELWELIRTVFKVLGKRYNCYFILMSATQPMIFEAQKEIQELIPNYQQYFNFFNRTKLINKTKEKISLEAFNQIVVDYHKKNPKKNILVILNTKEITQNCFSEIVKNISESAANLYFLSTSLTPFERKQIIQLIKEPKNKKPNIIISTQLIEAGVDISVQTVFRAMAPLDSIIQAAGRANRYAESPTPSEIYLYLIDELEKVSISLYGKLLMLKTMNVLREVDVIEEKNYLDIIEAYFKEIKNQSENITSKELGYLLKLKFEDLGKFNFIEYRKTESIYVQLNTKAKNIWNQYLAIYKNNALTIFEKREQFALIKADFYDYVVNVPVPWDAENIEFDSEAQMHFYLSLLENPSKCYTYKENDFRNNTGYQAIKEHTKSY